MEGERTISAAALQGLALALLAACASAPPTPSTPAPPPLLARSSIAALLEQRDALGLDDAQLARLVEMDAALERQRRSILDNTRAPREASDRGYEPPGGDGGGPVGGRVPGAGGGGGSRRGPPGAPDRNDLRTVVERMLDDADRQAFLLASQILKEEQRERAREIAERYRERLYDVREERWRDR